jgi:uncharacterized Zn-binding protein involved in type VI secretion
MPAVARQGDAGQTHCTPYTIAEGSDDVFVNNRPAARAGDSSTIHKKPGGKKCIPHVSTISRGSDSVFVNGKPLAREGDPLADCTAVAQGSDSVFAG